MLQQVESEDESLSDDVSPSDPECCNLCLPDGESEPPSSKNSTKASSFGMFALVGAALLSLLCVFCAAFAAGGRRKRKRERRKDSTGDGCELTLINDEEMQSDGRGNSALLAYELFSIPPHPLTLTPPHTFEL